MKIDWNNITPTDFEKLCFKLIEKNKFKNIQWFGKTGGDKGRDLTADKVLEILPDTLRKTKWVIQCKRYINKPPTKAEINSFLVDAEEHNPNEVLIILTNTLSPDTKDWIRVKNEKSKFTINIWEELDLEKELYKHSSYLKEFFPNIFIGGSEIEFYKINTGEYFFGCNEYEEAQIMVYNATSITEAKEKAMEFVKVIQENKIKLLIK